MGQIVQRLAESGAHPSAGKPAFEAELAQYLTFLLNGEMYAMGINRVKEIIEYGQLTEVPMMPNFVRGVINLRGAVVPVFDLAARFGGKASNVQRRTCIVIIEIEHQDDRHDVGIVVDAVSEVLEISSGDIEPPPAFGAKIRADFIDGMARIDGRFVIILDIQKVLSVEDIVEMTRAADGATETVAEAEC